MAEDGAGAGKRRGKGIAPGGWEPSAKQNSVTPVLVTPRFRIVQGESTAKLCNTCCVDIS